MLMLVNTHPAIDFPEPMPPNVIPVAGLQIKVPKPLPEVRISTSDLLPCVP
jgi:glucuronosyltransferase